MDLPFSIIGQKLTSHSGILELMEDLGRALSQAASANSIAKNDGNSTSQPSPIYMLGGGNPALVPAIQEVWRKRMNELLASGDTFDRMLAIYDPPQGNPRFVAALAKLLRENFGWNIGPENIAVTNGGQSAFFFLFNLLAGEFTDGSRKQILLPLAPEYIGYADQGVNDKLFVSCRPEITWPDGPESRVFKYRIDFAAVEAALMSHNIAAIAVSRPTNPTGNVLTDDEVERLSILADQHKIPLIIDNAYGTPFPGVIFTDAKPFWNENTIMTLSLSKLGLPGTRTAVVIGPPKITQAMSAMTAIAGLANGNIGQQIVLPLVENGEILNLGRRMLLPFYKEKSDVALAWIREYFSPAGVDWAVHASEGAFFHWLWLRDLAIPTRTLYERLKARNVLVVPGEYFFFGENSGENGQQATAKSSKSTNKLSEEAFQKHSKQCLRLNFSQPAEMVQPALKIIAEEAAKAKIA